MSRLARFARVLWAAPCSLVGLLALLPVIAAGGSVRRVGPTLEAALRPTQAAVPAPIARWRFGAITLGHVIVGKSHELLVRVRAHERVHVAQYERLGPLFFPAYGIASLVAWWRGGCPYLDNRYEREAFARAPDD